MYIRYNSYYECWERIGYTKEQVDKIIENLDDKSKEVLIKKWGEDLSHPTAKALDKEEARLLHNITATVKRHLENPNKNWRNNEAVKAKKENKVIAEELELPEPKEEISNPNVEQATPSNEDTYSEKLLELLKTPTFEQMLGNMNVNEAVIVALRLGYFGYHSTEEVADFLGIDSEEVRETTKKGLLLFKGGINDFLDREISKQTAKNKVLNKQQ